MSTKARLISTISAVCLILALLITGVWAVSTANVTLGGKVSLQTYNGVNNYLTGNIEIKNNTIENSGDRAIRFGTVKDATIVIEDNTFVDAVDSDKDLLKSQVSTGLEYEFKGNTYNGTALTTLSDTTTQLVINLADFGL